MVDKNSSIKQIFTPIFKKAKDTVEEATEIIPRAVSDIVVEPITRILTPGSTEEQRKARKDELFAEDKIREEMLEGIPSRVEEIKNINPDAVSPSRDQLLSMVGLEKDLKDIGYPDVTFKGELDKFRESFFGPEFDVHKQVADGSLKMSEMTGEQYSNYFFGLMTAADAGAVSALSAPVLGVIKRALSEKNISALKNIATKFFPDKEAQNISKNIKGTQDPITQEKIKKKIKDKQLAKIVKLDEQLGANPPDGKINATPMARMVGPGFRTGPIEEYAKNNPNSNVAKYLIKQVPRQDQLTDDILQMLKDEAEETGEKVNILTASDITGIPRTTLTRLINEDAKGISAFTSAREVKGRAGTFFESYFPNVTRDSTLDAKVQHLVFRDMYRSNAFGDETEFVRIMEDAGIVPNKIRTMEDGKAIYTKNADYSRAEMNERRKKLFEYVKKEYFQPGDYEKLLAKIDARDKLTDYTIDKFKNTVLNNEGFQKQFVEEYNKVYPKNTYGNDVASMAEDYATQHFIGQMAHIMPIGKTKAKTPVKGEMFKTSKGLEGLFFYPEFYSVNFAAHNIGLQNRYENVATKIIANLKKGTDVEKNINDLIKIDQQMNKKGIRAYLRFTDKQLPENVLNQLTDVFKSKVAKEPNQPNVNSIFIGRLDDPSLAENINYFDDKMDEYVTNPSSFKISQQAPKEGLSDEMFISGSAPYIMLGQPLNFEQGGDVETEQEKQSMVSKAASAIGDILIPKAEAFPLPKNFLLGQVPKIFKKTEVPKQLAPPDTPLLEKRYNIMDEAGNKVFQSKSLPDAEQKALQLGEAEGKPFVVQEIEVPVKKKKKKIETGTDLARTITPETIIGSGNNKLFYSDLDSIVNTETGNLTIKGITTPAESVSMSAKGWHDWFRSSGIKEGELYDSYIRSYLNKKGGFNRETGQFTLDEKIPFAEIKELVDTSPTNYLQTVSYSDEAGNLKYGDSGRQDNYIGGSRTERVLWLDSVDIRGDIGVLPTEIARYEGHGNMRNVTSSPDFATQGNKLDGEPYVIGWSLGSDRIGKLNNRDIVVTVADEIQSDFLQKAAQKKSDIKQDIRRFINQTENQQIGRNEGLDELYKRLENVFRPMPATFAQIKKALEQLERSSDIFMGIASMNLDDITQLNLKQLGEAATQRDKALAEINATIDSIDSRDLFPNIPFKDQKDWVDSIIKNDIYNAAKKRFIIDENGNITINNEAPSYYAVAPAKAVKAYQGGRGVEVPPDTDGRSGKMVAYDMQYGGPNLNDHTGQHFTSNTEETLKKIANMKNSKLEVGKVNFGYAGEAVDTFMIELTPEMLLPYKAYKKDGGLIKKSILYTPIVSLDKVLSPIGANRW
jgi:hypothetical protein